MEFHEAIRNILKYQGQGFLLDPKMADALVDFQAYGFDPALKNIFRILQADNLIAKIAECGTWDKSCDQLVYEVERDYAFPLPLVEYIFKSVAYGVGALSAVSTPGFQAKTPNKPKPTQKGLNLTCEDLDRMSNKAVNAYKEKCEQYLDSIIELKGDWSELGAKVNISSLYQIYSNDTMIRINFEVEGRITVEKTSFVEFNFVLFNHAGKILGKSLGLLNNPKSPYALVQTDSIDELSFKTVGNIARIVVYWDAL